MKMRDIIDLVELDEQRASDDAYRTTLLHRLLKLLDQPETTDIASLEADSFTTVQLERMVAALEKATAENQLMLGEQRASSLSNVRPYEWISQNDPRWEATFRVGQHGYWFVAYETKGKLPPSGVLQTIWVIQFGIDKEASIALHGHKHAIMNMTGLKKPFGIMATVLAIFEDFITQRKPSVVWFSDTHGSTGRQKLYQMASALLVHSYGYEEDRDVMQHFAKEGIGGVWMLRRPTE